MKRLKNVLCCLLPCFLLLVLFILDFKYHCPFKKIFKIPCPGCGMTRAMLLIFKGEIINSFHYHILALPLLIFIIFSVICLIREIIQNKIIYLEKVNHIIEKHFILIVVVVLVVWMFNVILNGKRL